jgi:hypothetical protein
MTVGTPKSVMCAEGETTETVALRIAFSNVGTATSVLVFKGSEQIGGEHAINNAQAQFNVADAAIGSYTLKVKNADNSLAASGYSFNIVAYNDGNGTGGDPGDVN